MFKSSDPLVRIAATAVVALGMCAPAVAQETWSCAYEEKELGSNNPIPQIIRLRVNGTKLTVRLQFFEDDWQIIANNEYGIIAISGDTGVMPDKTSYAWADVIVLNRKSLIFHWSSFHVESTEDTVHVGNCIPG